MIRKALLGIVAIVALVWMIALVRPGPAYAPHQPSTEYVQVAAEYLEQNLTAMPDGWEWGAYTADSDGKPMRWGTVSPVGDTRATVIFVPGYTGALEMYADYYLELLSRGYRVYGFDLRGQGGSARMLQNPEKPWVRDFGDYSNDLAGFVAEVRQQVDGPLILFGESFGGHVSLRATGDHALPLDALFLSVPAVRIRTGENGYALTRAMVEVSRFLGFGERYAPGQGDWQPFRTDLSLGNYCGNNLDRIHIKDTLYTERPDLRVGGATNQWTAEFMESSDHINQSAYMSRISLPVAIATGDTDAIVRDDLSKKACSELMPDCQVLVLENSGHCTISEPDEVRGKMFDGLDALLARLSEDT